MRVALLAYNAPPHNAVGNQIAEKVRFFRERGAEVRVFLQDARRLHAEVRACAVQAPTSSADGPVWDYLCQADLIFAVYAQYHDLLQYLPMLAGTGPRIVFDYLGVTPPEFWDPADRHRLESSLRGRGYVWCADHALTMSDANRNELLEATNFARREVTTLPLPVDVERFRPGSRTRFLQDRFGIAGPVLLFVGRLAGNKRPTLVIEALARLGDSSAHAVLVGDGSDIYADEAARCLTRARQLGLADRVHLTGELSDEDLPHAYRSADVLVMPSVHEGFCVPVLEAMASGCPVVASRSAALPETVGDAGLTFAPDDADDLARQIRRILTDEPSPPKTPGPRRVAVVSFRFGPEIVGGAESSLRTLAQAMQAAGHHVEVFTTCTTSESHWTNDLAPGVSSLAGLTVHRFPIDPHDPATHGELVRAIREADGDVPGEMAERYLAHSIHSSALLEALTRRRHEFDAIVVGPYLFGLTADIAHEFREQTLLVPCFHDEPLARLTFWPRRFGEVGGVLYHSVEEKAFAETRLGVNHPNAVVTGTYRPALDGPSPHVANLPRPFVVYCGRYSAQKNVPLLLDWIRRYREAHPDGLDLVFVGTGDIKLPGEPWLHDLGRLAEDAKHAVLAGAEALIQLSTQESLSLVALEAWAAGTPVIAHAECAVLAGQIERSQGGSVVTDESSFAATLDDVRQNGDAWRKRGENGRAYVAAHYSNPLAYADEVNRCIERMAQPVRQQMHERGLQRARQFSRERWQERFADFIEQVLTQSARPRRHDLRVEPMRSSFQAPRDARTLLIPVRLVNAGTHAATPDGPGGTFLCVEVREAASEGILVEAAATRVPALLLPGQTQIAAVPVKLPEAAGDFRVRLWLDGGTASRPAEATLLVAGETAAAGGGAAEFLDAVTHTLPQAHRLQQLPTDYVDVTEGTLAPVKRAIKRKLLHNFKHAYVDVLSRQQSQVNGQLVLMIQQLAECCAMLDHAVTQLHERVDKLEAAAASRQAAAMPQRVHG